MDALLLTLQVSSSWIIDMPWNKCFRHQIMCECHSLMFSHPNGSFFGSQFILDIDLWYIELLSCLETSCLVFVFFLSLKKTCAFHLLRGIFFKLWCSTNWEREKKAQCCCFSLGEQPLEQSKDKRWWPMLWTYYISETFRGYHISIIIRTALNIHHTCKDVWVK